ncbi:MAG: hypothetical protein GQ559_05975, partial [Desulfobulbaceae bacterium]|nr:hypothetical protein [Desulfobulbaceae bacterium]
LGRLGVCGWWHNWGQSKINFTLTPIMPPAAHPQTAKQRLNQLDKLAAGGYITPAEYKAKKKAIIDSM